MKKSIVALAVSSAALASVSAYAAEDTSVDFYGNIQYAYTNSDAGNAFSDNGSTLGVKGESKISDDVTAFFKYELEFDADEKTSDVDAGIDQAYVGVKGSFGKVQVGTYDTIYNNAIQDGIDQMENLGFSSAQDTDEGDTITYFSPSMGGFELQVAAAVKGDADDEVPDGTSGIAVLKYSTDMLTVALGYDSNKNVSATEDESSTGLAVTVTPMEELAVTVKYETTEDTADYLGLGARYSYGIGDIYGSIQRVSPDGDDDNYNEYAAGITYSVNSAMYVYTELGKFDDDTQSAIGVTYVF